jgi:hypothetical protein
MQNVIRFPRVRREVIEELPPPLDRPEANPLALASMDFQAATKRELHRSILLLDLAAQQARLFVKHLGNPSDRWKVETKIERLEAKIQTARELAARI